MEQAEHLRHRLQPLEFEGVWSSDLPRAADFALQAFGPARHDRRLREIDFGDLEGLTWEECGADIQGSMTGFEGFDPPGGEPFVEFQSRVLDFMVAMGTGKHLVFTHGGVIRLLGRMAGLELTPRPGEMIILPWRLENLKEHS